MNEARQRTAFLRGIIGAAIIILALGMAPRDAMALPASGGDTVRGFYDALLSTMKNGAALGQSGRFAKLEPVVRRAFDLPQMARLAVGPGWATLSEAQREAVADAFGRYLSAIYADRFDSYDGERLEVAGEQPVSAGVVVHSRIVKSDGEPIAIDYLMRESGAGWQISDVYLDGTISEMATRRSEFAAILQSQGIDGLISVLNRKAALLSGLPPHAS